MSKLPELTRLIDEAAFAPEVFDRNLGQIARMLGYDHGALVYSELDVPNYVATEETLAGLNAYAAEGWLDGDFRARHIAPFPIGRIFADSIHVPAEQRLSSDIYNEFYKCHDMANYVGWKFSIDDSVWIYSFARSETKGPIGPTEIRQLQQIAKAANRSALVAQRLRSARLGGMLDGLASVGVAALTLSRDGRVLEYTPQAEQIFDEEFGPVRGVLRANDRASQLALDRLAATARSFVGLVGLENAVVRRTDGRRPVLVEPITVRGLGLDGFPGARMLLVLVDLDQPTGAPGRQLMQLFHLSPAEADIAIQLSQGLRLRDIAAKRGVKLDTVRVQVKHLLQKLDASRQSDIVSLVARLAGATKE